MVHTFVTKKKWIKTDAWRGYDQPVFAVVGASDTGEASDSPAPSHVAKREIGMFRDFMKSKGIPTRAVTGRSSNVFMGKQWVIVPKEDFDKAKKLTKTWLDKHKNDTVLLHDAD